MNENIRNIKGYKPTNQPKEDKNQKKNQNQDNILFTPRTPRDEENGDRDIRNSPSIGNEYSPGLNPNPMSGLISCSNLKAYSYYPGESKNVVECSPHSNMNVFQGGFFVNQNEENFVKVKNEKNKSENKDGNFEDEELWRYEKEEQRRNKVEMEKLKKLLGRKPQFYILEVEEEEKKFEEKINKKNFEDKNITHLDTVESTFPLKTEIEDEERCQICYCHHPRNNFSNISNCKKHKYCLECLSDYVKSACDNLKVLELKCPNERCKESQAKPKVRSVLGRLGRLELYERYRRFLERGVIYKQGLKFCVNESCKKILSKTFDGNLKCDDCGIEICSKCMNFKHEGKECKEADNQEFENFKEENQVIQCPLCGVSIFKGEGCNHMTCSICKHQFCWICMKPYTPRHYSKLNPFGCPESNKKSICLLKCRAWLFWIIVLLAFPISYTLFFIITPVYLYHRYSTSKEQEAILNNKPYRKPRGCKLWSINLCLLLVGIIIAPVCIFLSILSLPCILLYLLSQIPYYIQKKKKMNAYKKNLRGELK